MRVSAQLSLLAKQLFPGSSYDEELASAGIDSLVRIAEARVYGEGGEGSGRSRELLSEEARGDLRRSLKETLFWMRRFRASDELVAFIADSWVIAQREMLQRLIADRGEIEARFGLNAGLIRSLDLDLSDRHNGGRTVAAITLDSGLKLIYKPRDIGIEVWFFDFLSQLNVLGAPLPFRALKAIARDGYGCLNRRREGASWRKNLWQRTSGGADQRRG